jgi:hypothetical protein
MNNAEYRGIAIDMRVLFTRLEHNQEGASP